MVYLAQTAAEFRSCENPPQAMAWMACHFSPYGTGLSNVPKELPPGSLLILNDRTPVRGHDPKGIAQALNQAVEELKCAGLLLDFQRPGCGEAAAIVEELVKLPCPVCVSECYARDLDCPVFLSPVPLNVTPEDHLAPWQGREVWLEAALDGLVIGVTEKGSCFSPLPPGETPECPHRDEALHCHYGIRVTAQKATFTLKRTREDLDTLLAEARRLGVTHAVGLYQELGGLFSSSEK